jgi:shikimate kinase
VSGDHNAPLRLRRILLVGFMGAGKSSVGRRLARALGWRFVDFDTEVTAVAGMSIPEIFETAGEAAFRELEAGVGQRLLERDRVVLASGGGWGTVPGRLDEVPAGTETFWLRVSAEEAVRRASARPGTRPLLAGEDPLGRARRLLAEREPRYARADGVVDTDHRSVEDVTSEILGILGRKYPEVPRSIGR